MARSHLRVYYDGVKIRTFGGNPNVVKLVYLMYQCYPQNFHPWMMDYPNLSSRIRLEFVKKKNKRR